MAIIFKDIWDSSKDGNRREQRSFLRVAIVATAIFAVILFVKKDSIVRWVGAEITIMQQHRQMRLYDKKIVELEQQIRMLTENRDTLEALAREKFLFAEPGDDVYIVEE